MWASTGCTIHVLSFLCFAVSFVLCSPTPQNPARSKVVPIASKMNAYSSSSHEFHMPNFQLPTVHMRIPVKSNMQSLSMCVPISNVHHCAIVTSGYVPVVVEVVSEIQHLYTKRTDRQNGSKESTETLPQ